MGSLIEELRRREAAARAEAGRLRGRIEELAVDCPERSSAATPSLMTDPCWPQGK